MKIRAYHIIILLTSSILGVMLAMQLKSGHEIENREVERIRQMTAEIELKKQELEGLKEKVKEMNLQLQKAAEDPEMYDLQQQLITYGILAGTVEVEGAGVQVTLRDGEEQIQPGQDLNQQILHNEDVLKVINELRAAGAEALSINDERIIATTDIRCGGPVILVNKNRRITSPFVIKAIGHPDTLYNSLMMSGGVIDHLKFWKINVDIQKVDKIVIPSYKKSVKLEAWRGANTHG